MKIFRLLTALALLAFGQLAHSAVNAVLIGSAGNGAGSTVTTTAGNSTGDTKFLIVVRDFTNAANDPLGTVSDSFSNTYTQIGSTHYDPSGSDALAMYLCEVCTGGASHTATMTFGTLPFSATVTLYAITGAATTALDQSNSTNGTSYNGASPLTVTTGTLSQANELIVAAATYDDGGDSNVIWTSSNLTLLESDQGGNTSAGPVSGAVGQLAVNATTSVSAVISPGSLATVPHNGVIAVATFKQLITTGASVGLMFP